MACLSITEGQRWTVVMTTSGELGVKLRPRIEEIEETRRELGEAALILANGDPDELLHAAGILVQAAADLFGTARKLAEVRL
jgi:hypothetical protein